MQAPKLNFYGRERNPFELTVESVAQGWRLYSNGNAITLVRYTNGSFMGDLSGRTLTLNCGSFDRGSLVVATLTYEAPSPEVTIGTTRIVDNMPIDDAYNDTINQVWAKMQHYYPE